MSAVEQALRNLGIMLPEPATPVANYVPFVRTGGLVVISGQLCLGPDGQLSDQHKGKLGAEVTAEAAQDAARLCAVNVIAQLKAAVGDLDTVARCVRLGGFINAVPSFAALAPVMNGASDLMVAALGDRGRHARSAIGATALPLGFAVEIEMVVEVR